MNNSNIFVRIVASVTIILLAVPTVRTAIHADEFYAFVGLQGTGSWASIEDVFTYPFSNAQLHYFLTSQGRIVPFSSVLYQGGFWLTTHLSVITHLSIPLVYAALKAALLVGIYFALRSWINLIARNFGMVQARAWSTDFALLVFLIFMIGARLDSSSINGLVTYPTLTYVPVILGFGLPSLITYFLSKPSRRWNIFGVGAAFTLAVILAFGYELNYISAGTVLLTLFILKREQFNFLRTATFTFASIFVLSFMVNRLLVARACATASCYEGTEISITSKLFVSIRNNLFGVIPFKHTESNTLRKRGIGAFSLEPGIGSPIWWTIAIVVSIVAFFLLKQLMTKSGQVPKLLTFSIFAIGLLTLLASCILTSVSIVAQNRLEDTVPYRGYVISWSSLSILIALVGIGTLNFAKHREKLRSALVLLSVVAGVMTIYLRPYGAMTMSNELGKYSTNGYSKIYSEIAEPRWDANADERRCSMLVSLGESRQANEVRSNIDKSFLGFHGSPFCKGTK